MKFIQLLYCLIKNILMSVLIPLTKQLISLYTLLKNDIHQSTRIDFPSQIKGKGKIIIQKEVQIKNNVFIKSSGKLTIGKSSLIHSGVILNVFKDGVLEIGERNVLESNIQISCKRNEWLIGNNNYLSSGSSIFSRENQFEGKLIIGNNSNISNNCTIDLTGNLTIGNYVAIAHNCSLFTHDHDYSDNEVAAWKGKMHIKNIVIEDGAWIGANATILPGVRIGEKSVVAAGSIVTKDVRPFTIVAGIPAKEIKTI